ncbi:hypothetical protein KBC54_04665 [Patescibacteria group bacterium]|nr:hypothetical protein [Patescibacteria group bacterium]
MTIECERFCENQMLKVNPSLVIVNQIHPNFRCVTDKMKTIIESFFHIQLFLPRVLEEETFLIDAFVDELLLGHKFIVCVFAVAVEIEDRLTLVLEFLDILADTSVRLIEFLVTFLPRIEYDSFEQFFVLGIRFDGFQELNKLLLERSFLNGFGVSAFLASMVVVRIAFAVTTSSVAPREWLIAMLTQNESPQWKVRIVKHTRLTLEMISAFHVLALSE